MSIRTKTLLITGITILGLLVTVSGISVNILLESINKLEVDRVQTNTQRVNEAMNVQLDYLRTKTTDWAYWDDTYNFIVDHNPQYLATNLVPETFTNTDLDSIIYIDTKGAAVYANSFDTSTEKVTTASASLIETTQQISKTLLSEPLESDITGLILLPEGPMYVAARQILHSDNTGPARGVLLFGKNLNKEEVSRLSNITKTTLEVRRADESFTGHDAQMVSELTAGKSFALTVLSGTQIAGYTLRRDIFNKNILLIDVVQSRDMYLGGLKSVRILLIGFGSAGVIFLITVLGVLNGLVLSPLVRLRVNVDHIAESKDVHQRLPDIGSKDELGALTKDLNKMLQSLEYSQQQLVSEQKKSQAYIDIVGVLIVVISTDQKILLLNKRGCEVLGVTAAEVVGKNWFEMFIPENVRETVKAGFAKIIQGEISELGSYENEVITKSGKRRLIAWRNTVIRNESGAVVATLSSGEDVTDTKMTQEKILSRAKELEEMNQTMVGRELKMAELKKEVEELKAKLGTTS